MIKEKLEYSIPHHKLSNTQKLKADEELRSLRFERLSQVSAEQKIYSDLISLKYKILDYLNTGLYLNSFTFAECLKKYVLIINVSRRQLASDL